MYQTRPPQTFDRVSMMGDIVRCDVPLKRGNEFNILVVGCLHIDSTSNNWTFAKKCLDEAKERGAGIVLNGDVFDAMCSKNDRRSTLGMVHPDIFRRVNHAIQAEERRKGRLSRSEAAMVREGAYTDALVDFAVDKLAPYAKNIIMYVEGNHESAIRKHLETDIQRRFCEKMRELGSPVVQMGYSDAFLKIYASRTDSEKHNDGTYLIEFTHGFGGARRSLGVLNFQMRMAASPSPDMILASHLHTAVEAPLVHKYVTARGVIKERIQWHCQMPSLKSSNRNDRGWHKEKGYMPIPTGAFWMSVYHTGNAAGLSSAHQTLLA